MNSSEDVSEELMKLLHSGGEEGESEEGEEGGEEEEMERPVAPLGQRQHTGRIFIHSTRCIYCLCV